VLDITNIEWDYEEFSGLLQKCSEDKSFYFNGLAVFGLLFVCGRALMTLSMKFIKNCFKLHRLIPLRSRSFYTRSGRVRLRYVSALSLCLFGFLSFGLYPYLSSAVSLTDSGRFVVASADVPVEMNRNIDDQKKSKLSQAMRLASMTLQKPEKPKFERFQTLEIGAGDTIAGLLQDSGVSGADAHVALKALSKHFNPRNAKAGQIIQLELQPDKQATQEQGEPVLKFAKLSMKISPIKTVVIESGVKNFKTTVKEQELQERTYGRFAKIENSVYGSAAKAGIPAPVIADLIRIYSHNVDFQRDVRRGDVIEVLYKVYETEDGDYTKYDNVLFASLTIDDKENPVYRYKMSNGDVEYFQENGQSVRNTLMKTPIDGARISSGFGMRRHPVLGYNKMHKGMDFAASTGTPIYAAGSGTVSYAGRKGGYGNYIKLRHNSELSTAYAHMSKFAKGMTGGKRVKQGDVIGYVGSTGRSTGPHLHYEVLLHGKQVNPKRVDLPTGEKLKGKQLVAFKSFIRGVHQQYVELSEGLKFAELGQSETTQVR